MADAIEFEVLSDLSPISTALIETNAESVKAWLTNAVAPYASLVVTDDAISDAKAKRADIRKLRTAIDSQRKAVKKSVLAPYERFEKTCKELDAILAEGDTNIDSQVKAIENERREAKIARLHSFFDHCVTDEVKGYVSWDGVFTPRWGNISFAESVAESEIRAYFDGTVNDLGLIHGLNSEFETTLLEEYANTHDIRSVLSKDKALKARQNALRERENSERQITPPKEKSDSETFSAPLTHIQIQGASPIYALHPISEPEPRIYHLEFAVDVTMEQAHALKRFLKDNNIPFSKI